MNTRYRPIYLIFLFFLLAWVLAFSSNTLGALANNMWSLNTLRIIIPEKINDGQIKPPPTTHPHGYLWLARFALVNNDPQRAIHLISQLTENNEPVILDTVAEVMYKNQQYAEAFRIWEEIGQINALEKAAQDAESKNDLNLAYLAYLSSYNINPEAFTCWVAFVLAQKEDLTEVSHFLQEAQSNQVQANIATCWIRIGSFYRQEQIWDLAETAYQNAVAHAPNDRRGWIGLGRITHESGGNLQEALDFIKKGIEVDPERWGGYYAIADILYRKNFYYEAADWAALAVERNPDNRYALRLYAFSLRESGQLDLSAEVFNLIIQKFPLHPQAYYEVSGIYIRMNLHIEAIEAIETALALSDTPNISYFLRAGRIFERSGLIDKALSAYTNALDLNPNSVQALEGIQRLTGSND